ncbi:MAG: threonine ammonia-lyase [Acidimicrobiales bacterium]|nr:threonine ammonia-lyase [Acidimicrobiales bacterium]RZV46117.1 MAG: threonine ammonia-lyase [Acidimicrobiales bacterium]
MRIEDITQAAERIRGAVTYTPLNLSLTLSEITGARVYLKFENLQYTGSFKGRGARNRLLNVEHGHGVIAMSAGNHAQGVAHHGSMLGIETTIVMPENTPFVKVARTHDLGATVELAGADVMESAGRALELAEAPLLEFIHPFDDPAVIAGQGTIALEMLEQEPELDIIVAAVGGGGLASGLAVACAAHDKPTKVIGVQTERYPSMADRLEARPSSALAGSTVADGIAVTEPGELTSAILAEHDVEILVVSETAIEESIALLLEIEKTVVEGAGAAALAAMIDYPDVFADKRVGLVLCGGNIDPRTLAVVTLRGLANQGRLNRIRVELDDTPGRLALVSTLIADAAANVVQVDHDGLGSTGARSTILDLRIDTLDHEHAHRVLGVLREAGLRADLLPW